MHTRGHFLRFSPWILGICWLICCSPAPLHGQTSEQDDHFEQHIRPVLAEHCIQCHGPKKQEGGLRLDTAFAMATGGDSGTTFVAGEPSASLLIEALKYEGSEMPPAGQLPAAVIREFEKWIADGAHWPNHTSPIRQSAAEVTDEDRSWWAFQPVVAYEPPLTPKDQWSSNEIDQFVLARLLENDMQPAPEADRATLVRRIYFDLLGVPPRLDEIDAFINDEPPDAWERLIDRLLSDKRYGEHWSRFWLDLVRYSESDGWNQDAYRPEIWRYRDYIIHSFNNDLPYPQFVLEQLAGDELPGDDPRALSATGYLRLGIYEYNQRDARGHWNDVVNEMTDVTGDAFLGMSMACCRCHDHKFDPLPQRDYFKLRAFFEPIIWRDDMVYATSQEQAAYDHQLELWQRATADIRERMDALLQPFYERKWASTVDKFPLDIQAAFFKPVHERSSWDQQMAYLVTRQFTEEGGGPLKDLKEDAKLKLAALEQELAAYDELKPLPLAKLMTATDFAGTISPTVIPDAAEPTPIEPGFITAISDFASADLMKKVQLSVSARRFVSTASAKHEQLPARTSGRRTALARWIGDANNPLTTRVIVNRIWQQHFGQGIVATPSDFGRNGTPPSHPELLDWLTVQFVADDWSFKQLHKRILMSSTWRQSADHPLASDHQSKDPSEQLLWRSRVRRLKAEQIRDSMLTLGGELDKTLGGPSVDESKPRRALYVQSFRNKTETFLHSFDLANGLQSVAERDATTTPVQALMLINGDYSLRSAAAMAQHVDKRAAGDSPAAACELALRLSWGRPPQQHELMAALQFVGASPGDESPGIEMDRLVDLCHVLLNSNEFLYIE